MNVICRQSKRKIEALTVNVSIGNIQLLKSRITSKVENDFEFVAYTLLYLLPILYFFCCLYFTLLYAYALAFFFLDFANIIIFYLLRESFFFSAMTFEAVKPKL